ncbi:enhanced serine sensitivity protein SseB C-terminal domain-containing protein [Kangiella aquimarina]|uniref:Enhanced serine sensitivity protein SseB C-terminal domain-containing protein n=1 Tax=Kangiella aquimarina TaxID=261965 RepID=A0ABZ0X5U1_9GAMM|nr:enhanced serine sensitivity protein SseB C-terminal domain-containing protein [Kangiella aquimarina]WQG85743.1 enhanced serine sensitivity protein SseB C-terminal domain-containing protein [Kangiella aquimarina]
MHKLRISLLLICLFAPFAVATKTILSPLDQAYEIALQDEQKEFAYYNLLLNSELYIPVHSFEKDSLTQKGGTFDPLLMKTDGVLVLMVFDSLERLRQWGNDELAYVSMNGRTLVEAVGSDLHWALNVGTEHSKIFVPDELDWLAELVADSKITEQVLSKDTTVFIRHPEDASTDLINAITNTFKEFPEVQLAYLASVSYETESAKPNLLLAIDSHNLSSSRKDELNTAITHAIIALNAGNKYLDLIYIGDTGIGHTISKRVEPIYQATTADNQAQ